MEQIEGAHVENVENADNALFNPISPKIESDVNNPIDEENLMNVPSD